MTERAGQGAGGLLRPHRWLPWQSSVRGISVVAVLAGLTGVMTTASAQPSPASPRGAELFANRCARCHGVEADGEGGLAPSLIGVVGRPAAGAKDYPYSEALKKHHAAWTPALLDQYLADPQVFAPGAEMELASPDPADRAALIEHLKTLR